MLIYILAVLAAVLLYLLYRYIPRRNIFYCFCLTLVAVAALAYIARSPEPEPTLTAEQRAAIITQQQLFAAWYEDYQRDLTELDRNWQWYHQILEDFKADNISIQTTYIRLRQLDLDSQALKERIASRPVPTTLDDVCYDNVASLIAKTNAYADAQYKTIALTKAAADPARLTTDDQPEQSRLLQMVMIRESPVGLYTAGEIIAIRNHLKIDESETSPQNN